MEQNQIKLNYLLTMIHFSQSKVDLSDKHGFVGDHLYSFLRKKRIRAE